MTYQPTVRITFADDRLVEKVEVWSGGQWEQAQWVGQRDGAASEREDGMMCICGHCAETHHYTPTPKPTRGDCHARLADAVSECECTSFTLRPSWRVRRQYVEQFDTLEAERDRYRAALSRVQFELKHPSMDRSEVARAKTIVEQALNEDMRDELVAENARLEAERDQAKHVAANHWTYAQQLKAERDQLREQLGVAREQHDNITRAMQERIEQARRKR